MLEQTILSNLIYNEPFLRKTLPFLKDEYFNSENEKKIIFNIIQSFVSKFNNPPTKEALHIELNQINGLKEELFNKCVECIDSLEKSEDVELKWLIEQTEKFCQDKSIYNAIMSSIEILDGKNKKLNKTAIPTILSDALAVNFDTAIGHDYLEDAEKRYDFYNQKDVRIPIGLHYLDLITNGGIPRKTLNAVIAGINVGKTLVLSDFAARYLLQGLNVLYITMEIAEERIAERIDQNMLDLQNEELMNIDKLNFIKKINKIREKTTGRLEIKEYPTSSASAANFRYLINELRIKKKFIPDVIMIDYLGICASSKFKKGNVNMYEYLKSIAEECRALMVETNCIGWTAAQFNRCLDLNTSVISSNGEIKISELQIGDKIQSKNGIFNQVLDIYKNSNLQKVFKIKMKSGKEIICSENHMFPTEIGNLSIISGLKKGNKLFTFD